LILLHDINPGSAIRFADYDGIVPNGIAAFPERMEDDLLF
jgi:hypothetical protein